LSNYLDKFIDFLKVSFLTFVFSFTAWVIWASLIIDTFNEGILPIGSLIFFPNAARVISICFFGFRAIPALYVAEILGPEILFDNLYGYESYFTIFLSIMAVPAALLLLRSIGFRFLESKSNFLDFRNYRHLLVVTVIAAAFNSIFVTSFLYLVNGSDISAAVTYRYFLGDIIGAVSVLLLLTFIYRTFKSFQ
jgi:hypothetical protein